MDFDYAQSTFKAHRAACALTLVQSKSRCALLQRTLIPLIPELVRSIFNPHQIWMLAIDLFLYFFLAQKKVTKKGAD